MNPHEAKTTLRVSEVQGRMISSSWSNATHSHSLASGYPYRESRWFESTRRYTAGDFLFFQPANEIGWYLSRGKLISSSCSNAICSQFGRHVQPIPRESVVRSHLKTFNWKLFLFLFLFFDSTESSNSKPLSNPVENIHSFLPWSIFKLWGELISSSWSSATHSYLSFSIFNPGRERRWFEST
jgi:hypothetical protein